MTDTDDTRYVDPTTWWERLYTPIAEPVEPDADEDRAEDDIPIDLTKAKPQDQGDDDLEVRGPSGWWRRSRPEAEPDAAPQPIAVPGMPGLVIVPSLDAIKPRLSGSARGDARWTARLAARRRSALYNGSAAALGWGLDLVHYSGQWIRLGAQAPAGTAAVLLAAAGGAAAWWISGRLRVLPYPYLVRPLTSAFAATYASQQAAALVGLMARHHIPVTPIMPVAAGLGLAAVLAFLDRYSRPWWPPLAWLLRAPLAAAVLALLLYPTTL
jgi:hypothetical protein